MENLREKQMRKHKKIQTICIVFFLMIGEAIVNAENIQETYFAGGCFWCMEPPFEQLEGVQAVISGYAGGTIKNPTYQQVSSGATNYLESIKVVYDAEQVAYQTLLNVFWRQIDPTDSQGQFVDKGYQYTSAIFYVNEEQKKLAEASKIHLSQSGWFDKPIVTAIRKHTTFYSAEDYHQDYYKKSTIRYKYYRKGSGRDQFLRAVWKKEVDDIDDIPSK